jgi:hypothetical protein
VFPLVTEEVYASAQFCELQFEVYCFWTSVGVAGTEAEFETPRENVLPRVSVGVEGGFWLYQPRA